MAANQKASADQRETAWRGFEPGPGKSRINVRDFIQCNYTPYEGDASFLAGATPRTERAGPTAIGWARRVLPTGTAIAA